MRKIIEKKTIWEFLKKNELCVLATASTAGKTEAAVMSYVIRDDFSLLISTETTTRKYKNIVENKQVSIVIGGFNNDPTVQIDGLIRELAGEEEGQAKNYILSIHSEWKEHFKSPESRFFEFKPNWLRYSEPLETVEITDFSL